MSQTTDRTSFIFYKSFYEAIKDLPKENQLEVYNLIFEYCFYGNEPKNSNTATAIFKLIKPNIDANNKRYFANIENGKKGGAPKGNQNAKKEKQPIKQPIKQPPKKNDYFYSKNEITEKQYLREENNPKTTQKQPKTTFNEDVDVDVDVDVDDRCIMNNNIKKKYLPFYPNQTNKKEVFEFVYLTDAEIERLISEFGEMYYNKAIEQLSYWKLEKLHKRQRKDRTGEDNLKIRKWVMSKVMEEHKKQDYEGYKKSLEILKKAGDPEQVRMIKELLDSGYSKNKVMLLGLDKEELLKWYNDLKERQKKGEYLK